MQLKLDRERRMSASTMNITEEQRRKLEVLEEISQREKMEAIRIAELHRHEQLEEEKFEKQVYEDRQFKYPHTSIYIVKLCIKLMYVKLRAMQAYKCTLSLLYHYNSTCVTTCYVIW